MMLTQENLSVIPQQMHRALEIIKDAFPLIEVEIAGPMRRLEPDRYARAGLLGCDIMMEGKRVFLGCESMAEEICLNPFGESIAMDFVVTSLGQEWFEGHMAKMHVKIEELKNNINEQ